MPNTQIDAYHHCFQQVPLGVEDKEGRVCISSISFTYNTGGIEFCQGEGHGKPVCHPRSFQLQHRLYSPPPCRNLNLLSSKILDWLHPTRMTPSCHNGNLSWCCCCSSCACSGLPGCHCLCCSLPCIPRAVITTIVLSNQQGQHIKKKKGSQQQQQQRN